MPWFQTVVVLMDLFERRAVSGKLLARAEIPGSEGVDLTLHCHHRNDS